MGSLYQLRSFVKTFNEKFMTHHDTLHHEDTAPVLTGGSLTALEYSFRQPMYIRRLAYVVGRSTKEGKGDLWRDSDKPFERANAAHVHR